MIGSVTVGLVKKPSMHSSNVRIDRQSVFGNPFYMADESKRNEVCDKYEVYFQQEVMKVGKLQTEFMVLAHRVASGESINLQCWCAPKRCHGDTIKRWLVYNAQLIAKGRK